MIESLKHKTFYLLWFASILGTVAVLPYAAAQGGMLITQTLVFTAMIQAALLYAFIIAFGMTISRKVDFKIAPSPNFLLPSCLSGAATGLTINVLDKFVFAPCANVFLESTADIASWKGVLASFYGGINEEILLRLFAVSLGVLLLHKFLKIKKSHSTAIAIIFCSLLFGIGHLPMLYTIVEDPNNWDLVRVLFLNGFAGVVFGFLYCRYGLVSSMLSHFIADLFIHVVYK